MHISYRTRHALKVLAIVLLVLAAVGLVVYIGWFRWIERYVVYTRDGGAVLNRELDPVIQRGNPAVPPEKKTVTVIYKDAEEEGQSDANQELTQMIGYYADAEMLADMDLVRQQIELLEPGTPVMLDVKDGKGRFYYDSGLSQDRSAAIDPLAMDALIRELDSKGMYLIARLPAFRDYAFGLRATDNGLFVPSGAYLWADSDYCYWLDPTKQGTISYLTSIMAELRDRGFDEVVFENFCFPNTTELKFSGDRAEAINAAAAALVDDCADQSFAVSFIATQEGFVTPGGRSRVYYTNAVAAQAGEIALAAGTENPAVNVVFLTHVHDTRFNDYSVLRPLDSAG